MNQYGGLAVGRPFLNDMEFLVVNPVDCHTLPLVLYTYFGISHIAWMSTVLRLKPLLKWYFSFAGFARKRKIPIYLTALAAKLVYSG
jgi:hypothetical protein